METRNGNGVIQMSNKLTSCSLDLSGSTIFHGAAKSHPVHSFSLP